MVDRRGKARTERLYVLVSRTEKRAIVKAAKDAKRSYGDFVRIAALNAAVMQEGEST